MKLAIASVLMVAIVAVAADNPDVRVVIEESDGGARGFAPVPTYDAGEAERTTFAQLTQLLKEYGCPDAGPPIMLDGGWRLEDPARAARVDCGLARTTAEVMAWRSMDAGAPIPVDQGAVLHVVSVAITAVGGMVELYITSKIQRKQPLWPPW